MHVGQKNNKGLYVLYIKRFKRKINRLSVKKLLKYFLNAILNSLYTICLNHTVLIVYRNNEFRTTEESSFRQR